MSACGGHAFIVLKYPLLQCLVTHIRQKEDHNFHNEIWSLMKSPLQRKIQNASSKSLIRYL